MLRAYELHMLDEMRDAQLVIVFQHRACLHDQPQFGPFRRLRIRAHVVAQPVRQGADQRFRVDRHLVRRRIPRRDFLNGVAIAVAGAYVTGTRTAAAPSTLQAPPGAAPYPPARTGLRGNYPEAVAAFEPIQRGTYRQFPALDVDTRESYDLVIVGAGISGLASAHFWRRALGVTQKILILDNHDDFGGHAKRNEFRFQARTF